MNRLDPNIMSEHQKALLAKWISAAEYIAPDLPSGLRDLLASLVEQSRESLADDHIGVLSASDRALALSLGLTDAQVSAWATIKRRYVAITEPMIGIGGSGCMMIGCFYDGMAYHKYLSDLKAGSHQQANNNIGIWLGIEPDGYTHS